MLTRQASVLIHSPPCSYSGPLFLFSRPFLIFPFILSSPPLCFPPPLLSFLSSPLLYFPHSFSPFLSPPLLLSSSPHSSPPLFPLLSFPLSFPSPLLLTPPLLLSPCLLFAVLPSFASPILSSLDKYCVCVCGGWGADADIYLYTLVVKAGPYCC